MHEEKEKRHFSREEGGRLLYLPSGPQRGPDMCMPGYRTRFWEGRRKERKGSPGIENLSCVGARRYVTYLTSFQPGSLPEGRCSDLHPTDPTGAEQLCQDRTQVTLVPKQILSPTAQCLIYPELPVLVTHVPTSQQRARKQQERADNKPNAGTQSPHQRSCQVSGEPVEDTGDREISPDFWEKGAKLTFGGLLYTHSDTGWELTSHYEETDALPGHGSQLPEATNTSEGSSVGWQGLMHLRALTGQPDSTEMRGLLSTTNVTVGVTAPGGRGRGTFPPAPPPHAPSCLLDATRIPCSFPLSPLYNW